jgi:hypothetical protein
MKTQKTPWPDVKPGSSESWSKVWPEITYNKTDPLQEAADFYIYTAIRDSAFVNVQPLRLPSDEAVKAAAEKLGLTLADIKAREKQVKEFLESDPRIPLTDMADKAGAVVKDQINRLAPVFEAYVHMACGGEIRHHQAIKGYSLSNNRTRAWVEWRLIFKKYGDEALLTMANLFREFNSKTYGDERWAIASEVLYQYIKGTLGPNEMANKELFVDRVFTLEHNGGAFLNKISWANKRQSNSETRYHDVNNMKVVLNAHGHNPPDLHTLHLFASPPAQNALRDYFLYLQEHNITPNVKWTPPGVAAKVNKPVENKSVKTPIKKAGATTSCKQTCAFFASSKEVKLESFQYHIGFSTSAVPKNTTKFKTECDAPKVRIEITSVTGKVVIKNPPLSYKGLKTLSSLKFDLDKYTGGDDVFGAIAKVNVTAKIKHNGKLYQTSYVLTNPPKGNTLYGGSIAMNLNDLIAQETAKVLV